MAVVEVAKVVVVINFKVNIHAHIKRVPTGKIQARDNYHTLFVISFRQGILRLEIDQFHIGGFTVCL